MRIASAKTTVPPPGTKEPPRTKRTAEAQRTQAENGLGPAVAHLVEPMLAGMTTTRQHLLAWVHAHGLAARGELFPEEAVAGPKGRHQLQRTHHHWGTAATELTFGGRRVQVRRPRVRPTMGGEATLPSVAAFRDRDPLSDRRSSESAQNAWVTTPSAPSIGRCRLSSEVKATAPASNDGLTTAVPSRATV